MTWIHPLSAEVEETANVLGSKGYGLVVLHRLGMPVPPGFVINTQVCSDFLQNGRFPNGLDDELTNAVADLEAATRRRLGGSERPLAVSVRSGGSVSMPGMMNTILNLGLTTEATAGLAVETGDPRFAIDSRERFLSSFAAALGPGRAEVPNDARRQLDLAIRAVFSSWDTPRAKTYRVLHDIPHDLGTAVIVQAMVFGNRGDHSGTGVAFSRNPNTGERTPFGEVMFGRQGEDVVSGRSITRPLSELAEREPAVWAALLEALQRIEGHYRDACSVEFTFELGRLWILQVRSGGLDGRAALRVAVDLADEGLIDRREALLRISPRHLGSARTPRIATDAADILTRGLGASPGVAIGKVATTADRAARMAADGPVILVRPYTSPLDMHGLAAAAGVVTARGGPTSHAAVVARALGKPVVVSAADLTVDVDAACVRAGGRIVAEGTFITIDGTGGEVVIGSPDILTGTTDPQLHRLLAWADELSGNNSHRDEGERLAAAHAVLSRQP
ncbi:pyruvate,orthophosphate dikinase [Kribbella sp. VKM Ac-2527]|uniref:Pyruvate,orthophosphate dikinase n=1 Tax=Kribbella caucasensis TaxID=2512215 RepID=A0A4R6KHZ7_9ACTN|nr:pyruvate, phosphate dikinase [Kribbella sp. VKM Ac-2527]TDO50137.1 pyruvate,orthophosphate dikinase [Kribbella sp. VKM Ac-2527]